MAYVKRLRTSIHGELVKLLEEEKARRGQYRGVEAEIVRQALRQYFEKAENSQ